MKRRKSVFPARLALATIVFLLFFLFLVYIGQALKHLDYFKIKYILSEGDSRIELAHLKGQNIFAVDLIRESRYISSLYPDYRKVKLIRVLPDRLFVDFIRRRPLAYVKLYRYFCVDEDLVLFDMPRQLEDPDLPIILGLDTKIFGARPGVRCAINELALSINIIKEVKMNKALKDYKIKVIDVANINNASFFISDGLEVKINPENMKAKINILASLLAQAKADASNIKYIDLRFKEPVIKLKDAK